MISTPDRVLIVEDEEKIASICSHLLGKAGYQADCVRNGAEALAKLKESDGFDLVFLDIRLPDRSGVDILRELKRVRPDIEVIMMTAPLATTSRRQ